MIPPSSASDVNEDKSECYSGGPFSGLGVLTLFAGTGVKPKPGVFADAFMLRFLVLEVDLVFGY
jgi:hypothetical protein